MLDKVFYIYQTPDLPWDTFTTPLKNYQNFFAKKINKDSHLANLGWRILQVTLGVFAYPFLTLSAALGTLLKSQHIDSITKHNAEVLHYLKNKLDLYADLTGEGAVDIKLETGLKIRKNGTYKMFYETQVTPEDVSVESDKLEQEIAKTSKIYRKVYPQILCHMYAEKGHISVQLNTLESSSK